MSAWLAQLGPGLPRDVLNTLLNGSKFDYVILGVTGKPGAVAESDFDTAARWGNHHGPEQYGSPAGRTTSRKPMRARLSPTLRKTIIRTPTRLLPLRLRAASAIP